MEAEPSIRRPANEKTSGPESGYHTSVFHYVTSLVFNDRRPMSVPPAHPVRGPEKQIHLMCLKDEA